MSIPGGMPCSALLLNGTVGAGKTSVAEKVGDLLSEAGVPNADRSVTVTAGEVIRAAGWEATTLQPQP